MNRVVLVGRLTKDPELRYTQSNKAVATFTIAVNRQFTNANGEREADFINCVVWGKPAENVSRYMKKGGQVGVDGRMQTRNYQANDGTRRYVTEVVAESVQFLESRNARENSSQGNYQSNNSQGNNQSNSYTQQNTYQQQAPVQNNDYGSPKQTSSANLSNDDFANFGANIDITDDDLPF
jgi:single-strand DNA-binding protein